ncbi:FecR domain-containing protein [Adhaeribacter sp. BT258]|uniref:FecR domain-containing protein n=1 Tax=Adhaeribacter terrigena TaxID=2793070 RepID=A0ABS1C3N8_9BACT|nr:FecR domain-containing protein [Adhaeribacter terrigena]MBK0404008.1 FecR domain-containing protein [Adhaeribacter terrigena]
MEKNGQDFWEKLAREVSGNAAEADKTWLRVKREQDPEAETVAEQTKKVWAGIALPETGYEPDVEKGWQRFQLKVQTRTGEMPETAKPKAPVVRKMPLSAVYGIAASLALFILVGIYFITRATSHHWTEVTTAANETKTIMLADGSKVSLNQNSTFAYPENFQKENRTVKLTGEAFFEVAKAEGKRFTIFAQGTKTEVIGTSFNLRAYDKKEVKVQVVTGKVAFARTETDDAVFLTPGQEGVIGEKTVAKPAKKVIAEPNFQAWKTKQLNFNNQRLEQITAELETYFNIEIEIQNPALNNCRFTTSFQEPELQEVLDILTMTGNLTITKQGEKYLVNGKGCN